jgi:pyruvate dehydrogenase E2 component (dihydrolipoamide acetyltransferase)
MPYEFKLADIGEGIAEAEVLKWLVKEGQEIKQDQILLQVETDKAVVDLTSPVSGKIIKINFKPGNKVKVGSTLVLIQNSGKVISKEDKKEDKKKEKGKSVVGQLPEAEEVEEKPFTKAIRGENQSLKILAAPAVRKMASDKNIDLHRIKGSGDEGKILMKDLPEKEPIPEQSITVKKISSLEGKIEKIPLVGIRKSIAENVVTSLSQTAQVTIMADANIDEIYKIREKEKIGFQKRKIKLTFLPFIIKALVASLKENPILNSSIENNEIILKKYYNIGIAVETELGLLVPVIKSADHKSIESLAKEIEELAEKARTRQIKPEEMQSSTFTITNYGSFGGKYATPILNLGESGILGIGAIYDHLESNKGKIKEAKKLPLSLTFDHRIIDGAQASKFLKTLCLYLEDPEHLLLEID